MTSRRARDFVQPHWRDLDPYEAAEPPELLAERAGMAEDDLVKLNANENPYGPSPKALAALSDIRRIHIYPDPAQVAMRAALSEYVGVGPEHVVVGNGSDEIIDLVFRAVLGPGDAVVNSVPTFGMYDVTARICGGAVVEVERDAAFRLDVERVLDAARGAKIIVLASPNNPSGNATPLADVERLLDSDCVVVVDEAYAEFSGGSAAPLVRERPNLVVLRTLSKWAGLAGLRVGYGVMDAEMADVLMRGKPPYNVSQAAETALLASLADAPLLMERAALIIRERERMAALLDEIPGVDPLPSEANFILCRLPDGQGRAAYDGLAARGVSVRYYARGKLADYLRISVGTPDQTDRLIDALRDALRDAATAAREDAS